SSPPVFLEFWGSYWNVGDGPQQANQIIDAAKKMFASPYFSRQATYGTDGLVTFGNAINYNTDPTDGFSSDQIETVIQTAIDGPGPYFPEADETGTGHQAMYVVFTPPGIRSSQLDNARGYNSMMFDYDAGDIDDEVYAWVGGGGGSVTTFVLDNYTQVLSHE